MKRSLVMAGVLAAVAAGAMACSDETAGQATPGSTTATPQPTAGSSRIPFPTGSMSTQPTQPSGGSGGTSPIAGKEPCEVAAPVASKLHTGSGTSSDVTGTPHCRFTGDGFVLDVALYPDQGLSDLPGDGKQISVGSHQGIQVTASVGVCTVAIGVTDTSRVDVNATKNDGSDACGLVMDGATALEPSLPR